MWVRLDDGFYDHPKARAAGKDGRELFVAGLCRVAATLSDGFIPDADLALVAAKAEVRPRPTATKLAAVGLWERVDGGWLVHDYHDYNPTAEAERDKRRKRAEAGRKGGLRSRPPDRNGQAAAEANASPSATAKGEAGPKQNRTPSPSPYPLPVISQSVTSTEHDPDDDDRDLQRLTDVAEIVGDRDHERALTEGVAVRNRHAHRKACIDQRVGDQHLADLVVANPHLEPEQLAELVDPPPATGAPVLTVVPRVAEYVPEPAAEAVPAESARALIAAQRARLRGDAG